MEPALSLHAAGRQPFCPRCGKPCEQTPFCGTCGAPLAAQRWSSDASTRRATSGDAAIPARRKRLWGPLAVLAAGFAIACIAALFFSLRETAQTLQLGDRSLRLSHETQFYLRLVASSEDAHGLNIVIVEEPHYDLAAQWRVYQGLTSLLAEYPEIAAHAVFLAEGLEAGTALSVADVVAMAPDPLPETVRVVLRSFLLPAYVAYEWRHEAGVPILGTEDPALYTASAQLWAEKNYGESWLLTVTARNRGMAEAAQSAVAQGKVVFLFMGGRHLQGLHQHTYRAAQERLGNMQDPHLAAALRSAKNWGVLDYLRDAGIGYYVLVATSGRHEVAPQQAEETYRALFKAQASGNYREYIDAFVTGWAAEREGGSRGARVTTRPAPHAAAQLLLALQAASTAPHDAKQGQKDEAKDKDEADEKGRWPDWLKKLVRRLKNLREMDREHTRAVRAEQKGNTITGPDGKPYDHITEVKNLRKGLRSLMEDIRGALSDPTLTPEQVRTLTEMLGEVSRSLDAAEGALGK